MDEDQISNLLKAISIGDKIAFKTFFDRFYPRLYRLAYYYLHSDVLSEELVSDIFIKIWNRRDKLTEIKKIDFYLFQSVKNQSYTYLKKESQLYSLKDQLPKSPLIEYNEPEKLLIAQELASKIEQIISQLPDRCEMIFRMVREEEMSYKEVAELLEISSKTVENQMNIALKKIKIALDEYHSNKPFTSDISSIYMLLLIEVFAQA